MWQWTGMEKVITTCMTIWEVVSTGTIFLHLFWQLGDPFHPNFASLFPTSGLCMTIYCYMDLFSNSGHSAQRKPQLSDSCSFPHPMSGKFLKTGNSAFPGRVPGPGVCVISPQGASLSPSAFLQGCRFHLPEQGSCDAAGFQGLWLHCNPAQDKLFGDFLAVSG